MTAPENVIIKEPGPFYDQPYWVEDYYDSIIMQAGSNHARIAFGPVTDYLRQQHKFPKNSAGVVVTFSNPHEPREGQISGFILDNEQYERFTRFIHNGYRLPDKNNFVLIDDLVATIVHNDIFDNSQKSLDEIYDIIREAVYKVRPNSGPDDVWVDTIIDALYDRNFVEKNRPWTELREFFTKTFTDLVYGHHPKPEPPKSFTDALEAEITRHGYSNSNPGAPTIRDILTETATKEPYTPWMKEPTPSPMRDSGETVKAVKEQLYDLGYLNNEGYSCPNLDKLLEQTIYRTNG